MYLNLREVGTRPFHGHFKGPLIQGPHAQVFSRHAFFTEVVLLGILDIEEKARVRRRVGRIELPLP